MRRTLLTAIDTIYDGKYAVGIAITHAMDASRPEVTQQDILTSQPLGYETKPASFRPVSTDPHKIGVPLYYALNRYDIYHESYILDRLNLDMIQFACPRPLLPQLWSNVVTDRITDGFLIEFPLKMLNEEYTPPPLGGWRSLFIGSTNLDNESYLSPLPGYRTNISINQLYYGDEDEPVVLDAFPMNIYTEYQEDVFPWPTNLKIVWDGDRYKYASYNFTTAYNGYFSVPRNKYYSWTPTPRTSGLTDLPDPEVAADVRRMPFWRQQARKRCRTPENMIPKANEIPDMYDLFYTKEDDFGRPVLSFFPSNFSLRKPPRVHIWNETGAFPLKAQEDLWIYVNILDKTKTQVDTLKLCSAPQGDSSGRGRTPFHSTEKKTTNSTMQDYGAIISFIDAEYGWYELADCPYDYLMINNKKYMLLQDKEKIGRAIIDIMREIDGRDRLLDIRGSL